MNNTIVLSGGTGEFDHSRWKTLNEIDSINSLAHDNIPKEIYATIFLNCEGSAVRKLILVSKKIFEVINSESFFESFARKEGYQNIGEYSTWKKLFIDNEINLKEYLGKDRLYISGPRIIYINLSSNKLSARNIKKVVKKQFGLDDYSINQMELFNRSKELVDPISQEMKSILENQYQFDLFLRDNNITQQGHFF